MNKYLETIEAYKTQLENMPLTIKDGTKKVKDDYHINAVNNKNESIKKIKDYYNLLLEQIKSILLSRKESLTPKATGINYSSIDAKNNQIISVLTSENKYASWSDKLGLRMLLSKLDNSVNVELNEINDSIKKMLEIFNKVGLGITLNDFKYSIYTYQYMTVYLNNNHTSEDLKNTFESIYWNCPDIITHLKLNFYTIINNHEKELSSYVPTLVNSYKASLGINEKTKLFYKKELLMQEKTLNSDIYRVTLKFINKEVMPDDYLVTSPNRQKIFNKYLNNKEFSTLTNDEKIKFYTTVDELSHIIEEFENYNFFKLFIKDVRKRMESNTNSKGKSYIENVKKMEKDDKERLNAVNKMFPQKTLFGMKEPSKDEKYFVAQINAIKNINNLYNELKESVINDKISNLFTDSSSIEDALMLCAGNYDYYCKLFAILKKEDESLNIDETFNRLLKFVFNPFNGFLDRTCIKDEFDAENVICKKYNLLGFNLTKEDLKDNIETIKSDIEFIKTCLNFESLNLNFESFITINKIDKLGL